MEYEVFGRDDGVEEAVATDDWSEVAAVDEGCPLGDPVGITSMAIVIKALT